MLVLKGQPLNVAHVGVLFESPEAAGECCADVNLQTTGPDVLEVRKVWVREGKFQLSGGVYRSCLVLLGEAV